MFANTENRMTLRVLDTAQWERCAAKLLSIPAIILLFGETQKCLYLSQISMDFNSVKKHLFASVLPHLLSTLLTSSFNIWMVQVWLRTFPLCHHCPRKQKHQSESPRPITVPGGHKRSTLKVSGGLKKFGWAVFDF